MPDNNARNLSPAPAPALLAAFVVVDLLMLPRLLFAFGIPLSLLVVAASIVSRNLNRNSVACLLLLGATMFASVAYGTASGHNTEPVESLKRAIQLLTILLYAFYRVDLPTLRPVLVKILRVFYLYVFAVLLLFYVDPNFYEALVARIYPEALDELSSNLMYARFAYLHSDPNSAAYLICFTLVVYLALEQRHWWAVASSTLAAMAVLATQSRGAYVALALILGSRLFMSETKLRVRLGSLLAIGFVAGAIAWNYSDDISQAYSLFEARFEQEDDLGGGRAGKYAYFVENLNLLPFGTGYHLKRDGFEFRPHSDLIRVDLAYGILALPMLLYFALPRRRSQVLLFVVFTIPFLINTVIDDYRLFGFYLLALGLLGHREAWTPALPRRTQAARTQGLPA